MTHVVRSTEALRLDLPGRTSYEIVSAARNDATVTLRKVEIPPAQSHVLRSQHRHTRFEECIYVLSGRGMTTTADGEVEVGAGDTILVPREEFHATRNIGTEPLVLLCFFPVGDMRVGTEEGASARPAA
jgi:mannose-6-phosphate isomerase-like protein (cupin superfamily)